MGKFSFPTAPHNPFPHTIGFWHVSTWGESISGEGYIDGENVTLIGGLKMQTAQWALSVNGDPPDNISLTLNVSGRYIIKPSNPVHIRGVESGAENALVTIDGWIFVPA